MLRNIIAKENTVESSRVIMWLFISYAAIINKHTYILETTFD